MATHDYDLFVIGGGSGGVRAARISAQHGAKVGLAEEFRYGGTCVIRGCVPKKLYVYASKFRQEFALASSFGWQVDTPRHDWQVLVANKEKEITRLEGIYRDNLAKAGVEMFDARAQLLDGHSVHMPGIDKTVTAGTILLATGGAPFMPNELPGIEHAITSNEAFDLDEFPKRVAMVGGGYIAVEFAGIFAGLGAETTLLYRGEEILRGFDDDVRQAVHASYDNKGINVVCGAVITSISKTASGLDATLSNGDQLQADQIMMAVGRIPNTANLGLEQAGVALDDKGAVIVDGLSKSNIDSIYAVGDVTNRVNLTPVAIREGHAFADTLFGGRETQVDHSDIATAVFSQPEIGTVGLTEAAARAAFEQVDIYKSSFRPMKNVFAGGDTKMLMKLIVDGASDRILGCHIVGPEAGEMAQLLGIAVKMRATKADFDATIAVHPTASEELVTMREKAS